jgi:hypothetical protein
LLLTLLHHQHQQQAQQQRLSSSALLLQRAQHQRGSRQRTCRVAAAATAQQSSSSSRGLASSRAGSPQLLEMPPRNSNTAAVGSTIKYRIKKKGAPGGGGQADNPVGDFMSKLKLAWQIFFPDSGEPAAAAIKVGAPQPVKRCV